MRAISPWTKERPKKTTFAPNGVASVELNCPFEGSYGFFPASLTPLNGTHQREYPGIIWQAPACNFELSQSAIVVEVSAIKVVCSCEVRFAGIWADAKCVLDSCF